PPTSARKEPGGPPPPCHYVCFTQNTTNPPVPQATILRSTSRVAPSRTSVVERISLSPSTFFFPRARLAGGSVRRSTRSTGIQLSIAFAHSRCPYDSMTTAPPTSALSVVPICD